MFIRLVTAIRGLMQQRVAVWAAASVLAFLAAVGYTIGADLAADRHRQHICYSHAHQAAEYADELDRIARHPLVATADQRYELKVLAEAYSRWPGIGYARNGHNKWSAERSWNEATAAIRIAGDEDTAVDDVRYWVRTAEYHTHNTVVLLRWYACGSPL